MALREVEPLGVTEETDKAGNHGSRSQEPRRSALLVGGPSVPVPNGGWLDGALDVVIEQWR